jgi:hypothetical protein
MPGERPAPLAWAHAIAMAAATLALGCMVLSMGDVLPDYGWDGTIYGRIAEKGPFTFLAERKGNLDPYYVRRMLPAWVIHHVMSLLDVPLVMKNVIRGYQVLNLCALTAAALVWGRIATLVRLSVNGAWVGWAALFLCCASAKLPFFYPALTDTSAFALGVFTLWAYLRRWSGLVFLITCVAAFCWPSAPILGMVLFVFPRLDLAAEAREPGPRVLPALAAAVAFAATLAGAIYVHWLGAWTYDTGAELLRFWAPLSALVAAGMAGASTYVLLDSRAVWPPRLSRGIVVRAPLAAGLIWAIGWAISLIAWGQPKLTTERFVLEILWHAILAPGQAIVAHTVFFGPIFALLLLRFRAVGRLAQSYGPGMVLLMLLLAAQLIHPESRRVINIYPFLAFVVVQTLDEELTPATALVFVALSLLYSRAWDRFDVPHKEDWRVYVYFMTQGPWLRMTMWVAQGLGVIMTLATFSLLLRRRAR